MDRCRRVRPAEAVTWGKVDKDTYLQATESMQADYSMVMPFLVKALLDNRKRYAEQAAEIGEEKLFERTPEARGYLRPRGGYRLFEQREELVRRLTEDVKANKDWLLETSAVSAGCALGAAARWDRCKQIACSQTRQP